MEGMVMADRLSPCPSVKNCLNLKTKRSASPDASWPVLRVMRGAWPRTHPTVPSAVTSPPSSRSCLPSYLIDLQPNSLTSSTLLACWDHYTTSVADHRYHRLLVLDARTSRPSSGLAAACRSPIPMHDLRPESQTKKTRNSAFRFILLYTRKRQQRPPNTCWDLNTPRKHTPSASLSSDPPCGTENPASLSCRTFGTPEAKCTRRP